MDPENISQFLIKNDYLLTALEFYAELCEAGIDIPSLRKYFGNAANFEVSTEPREPASKANLSFGFTYTSSKNYPVKGHHSRNESVSTVDTLDDSLSMVNTESVDVVKEREEQISVLQYELRQAHETIDELRTRLTTLATGNADSQGNEETKNEIMDRSATIASTTETEKRALNYLVNEYLSTSGFKMTTITFSNENDEQDLESWKDVGVDTNIPCPLVEMFRNFSQFASQSLKLAPGKEPVSSIEALVLKDKELQEMGAKNQELLLKIEKLEKLIEQQGKTITENNHNQDYPSKIEIITNQDTPLNDVKPSESLRSSLDLESTLAYKLLQQHFPLKSDSVLDLEIESITKENQTPIQTFASCLPNITKHVLVQHRDEVIPVIITLIKHHPDHQKREELTKLFFDLIKVPKDDQRFSIIQGCIALAKSMNDSQIESELLPHIWEQVDNKFPERRALVAEACGHFAPLVAPPLRSSLMLSILQQLIGDKVPDVREAVAKNLALLISFNEDFGKISQFLDAVLQLVQDDSPSVVHVSQTVLVPVFLKWASSSELFFDQILFITNEISKKLLKYDKGTILDPFSKIEIEASKIEELLKIFLNSFKIILSTVLNGAPFIEEVQNQVKEPEKKDIETLLIGNPEIYSLTKQKLNDHIFNGDLEKSIPSWPQFLWLTKKWIPSLINLVTQVDMINTGITKNLYLILRLISKELGTPFTNAYLKPIFLNTVMSADYLEGEEEHDKKTFLISRARVLPAMVNSMYINFGIKETLEFFKSKFISISIHELNWETSDISILVFAMKTFCEQDSQYPDLVFDFIETELFTYSAPQVRANVVKFLKPLIDLSSAQFIPKKIIPLLTNMATDPDIGVRRACVQGLGEVVKSTGVKENLEFVTNQLQTFLANYSFPIIEEILLMFVNIISLSDPIFRDEFVLPTLVHFIEKLQTLESEQQKKTILTLLINAYHELTCCYISEENIVEHFLPGLNALQKEIDHVDLEDKNAQRLTIAELIEQTEEKLPEKYRKGDGSDSDSQGHQKMTQFKEKLLSKINANPNTSPRKNWFNKNK